MPYGSLTVADIRKAIEGMPDDSPVLVQPHDAEDFASCEAHRRREGTEVITIPGRPAKVWNYKPRELHNAYQACDDRYTQNLILLLEIGEQGP